MATPAAISSTLVFLLVAFTASVAGAATFTITNQCRCMLFAAATPLAGGSDGGTQLKPGGTWTITVAAGSSGRIWSLSGCSSEPTTGVGEPPATLAEFTLGSGGGAPDKYGISVVGGFNIPMDFACSTCGNADAVIRCRDPGCPDGNHHPGDRKYRTSQADSDYVVVFCPST